MGRCACDEVVRLAEAEGRAAKRPQGPARTRRAMQKQQRAKAGMKPPMMKCDAKKEDDSFRSRNERKSERKGSR